ncbi:peptidyl-prolyl cis-trans isomerase [Jeongeupia sp. HS-3]|uniref:peptidylprolyl isomerase n=1 Tax=Jeongeupia sp. HS-3 TaxID=1009682 RepID=UPI0018A4FCEA|nr:peptidylprolyl isomerase [Jeongeupia sp. HS-3]BCL76000.1 peptidyl-prolyl cis-trans isomerase [Jeongeupia sp. HS-3]
MMSETASVNGQVLASDGMANVESAAVYELLRQRAVGLGLLDATADPEAVELAVEALLERDVQVPEADEAACRRFYDAHAADYVLGERVGVRHILFRMSPAVPVAALLNKAQEVLQEVLSQPALMSDCARRWSNCPSSEAGGSLGLLSRGDTAPEFEQAVFGGQSIGVLPQLVRTRYGFHVVAVDAREPGKQLSFEQVKLQVSRQLHAAALKRALSQYVQLLAGEAQLSGVELEQADSPLLR